MKKSIDNVYQCNACNRIFVRESGRPRLKSYCEEMGKKATLLRVDDISNVIEGYKKFLINVVDLNSFSAKQRIFIESAFVQGAEVMFHSAVHLRK